MIGLLVGTVLYIIGGYFLPFLVYSTIMLLCVPFVAKFIPSKPLEDKDFLNNGEKASDDDVEMQNSKNQTEMKNGEQEPKEASSTPTVTVRRRINPFKLVWRLLKNKVRPCYFWIRRPAI